MPTQAQTSLLPGAIDYLKKHHTPMCRQWFEELDYLGDDGLVSIIRAGSPIHTRYLQNQAADAFSEAFQHLTGELRTVRFIGPDDPSPVRSAPAQAAARHSAEAKPAHHATHSGDQDGAPDDRHDGSDARINGQHAASRDDGQPQAPASSRRPFVPSYRPPITTRDGIVINPDCTFDHFVVGPENKMAHAASKAVADNPGRAYNPLFIHGGVGLGKSHLLQAVCHTLLKNEPEPWIHYVSCESFMTDLLSAVQAGDLSEFRHRYRDVDCLVIDDIHFLTKRDQSQEEFFHTFNILYQAGKQIVLSSDAPPQQIPDLEQRLVSRFSSGLVTEIQPPGYETRIQVVKSKARLRGIEIPDEVACYIAAKISTNIREIEGAITKVHVQAMTDEADISELVARRALGTDGDNLRPEVRISNIIDLVIDHYGVKITDLLSKKKPKSIALPRQVCMYLAREHTRNSLQEIGVHFGGRDHTTVIHAHRVIAKKRTEDEEFDRVISSLESRL